jgi:hypothetical protein
VLRTASFDALQAVSVGARIAEKDVQKDIVIHSGKDAALQGTPVDGSRVALGSNYEACLLGLEKLDGIRHEVCIETVTLEDG